MGRKAIETDVPGVYRVWYRRWWWPFWRFSGFETVEQQPLTKDEVVRATKKHYKNPKNLAAARTVRGFAEIRPKKMDLRGNPGQTYRPPPRLHELLRKTDDRPF